MVDAKEDGQVDEWSNYLYCQAYNDLFAVDNGLILSFVSISCNILRMTYIL